MELGLYELCQLPKQRLAVVASAIAPVWLHSHFSNSDDHSGRIPRRYLTTL
jgi:hypothetical protein